MDITKLHQLYESMKTKPDIQVGVFQGKDARPKDEGGGMTNAYLASIHEYGAPEHGLPARSVLRTPIADHAKEIMEAVRGQAEELLKEGGSMKLWKLIGHAAEAVVQQAFASAGFGKWAPLSYKTLLRKLNRGKRGKSLAKRKGIIGQIYAGQVGMGILIYSAQLRRAYSSRVRMGF